MCNSRDQRFFLGQRSTRNQRRHMLQSVVVDGNDVLVSAKEASQISLARMEARETAAKTKAKREEERVNQLKKVRGEKWLPSIASKMKKE
uniref:Uncharacterized protein n=1 Tax=Aegilops tauschii subsp. strangulata TaxID=200361 RepID=A0A453IQN8_AEGTS